MTLPLIPDFEITRYLTQEAKFEFVPAYAGAIEWKFQNDTIALGMLQVLVENHGNGYNFMLTRINNFIERVLHQEIRRNYLAEELKGSLTEPVAFEELSTELQIILGANASEQARLIGIRTAEMHLA